MDGARIGIIDGASTSPKLLEVLLKLKYGIEPGEFVGLQPQEYDAFLLIGNRALRQRRGARGFPHRYDLGREWNEWTGLPFVFSRWIARNDMDTKELALLEDTLYVGLEDGVDTLYHLNEPRDDLLMLPRDVVIHLQGIRYFIGLSEQKGSPASESAWDKSTDSSVLLCPGASLAEHNRIARQFDRWPA